MVLIFVGLFFVFWVILVNVPGSPFIFLRACSSAWPRFYGVWLHQNYLRDRVAARSEGQAVATLEPGTGCWTTM